MSINLLEDVAPASEDLGAVVDMALAMQALEEAIASTEESLKQMKQELTRLAEQGLPDLMQNLRIQEFTLDNGNKVEVQDVISASVPSQTAIDRCKTEEDKLEMKLRLEQCLAWLRENGAGDIIKSNVEVRFGKDEDERANEFCKSIVDRGLVYKRAIGVHPGTLTSFIKEQLSVGKNIPHELFRVYSGRKAIIKRGK